MDALAAEDDDDVHLDVSKDIECRLSTLGMRGTSSPLDCGCLFSFYVERRPDLVEYTPVYPPFTTMAGDMETKRDEVVSAGKHAAAVNRNDNEAMANLPLGDVPRTGNPS